jgi:hypothetical protein
LWHALFAAAITLACASAFYARALVATHGDWPAPLDDVFIHYDFARSTSQLHPFEWIAGQGYSSGDTSLLYPFLLAPGYLVGFRGLALGAWAAALACASLFVMMRALRELVAPSPEWVAWLGAVMLLSVGPLDWTWFSGMEGAVFTAALATTLVRTKRAREAPPTTRRKAQWIAGAWGAMLVLLRPEATVLVAVMSVAVARRALSQSAASALGRSAGPAALATVAVLVTNRLLTGELASAGALVKLLFYRPFLSEVDRAKAILVNLASLKVFLSWQLGRGTWLGLALPSLSGVAVASRRTRAIALVCVLGAIGWTLLVSWNDAARFQNFRYYMPALALVLFAAALGLSALAHTRTLGPLGATIAVAGVGIAATGLDAQATFFANASANVHDQQVEVGRRLADRMPANASVLVGDAGAIPYLSGRHAVDALGLGGYRGWPFARAGIQGEGATVELIERMSPSERPGFMALYPNWFGGITSMFAHEVDHVSLAQNFVCGGLTKGIYEADWSALADDAASENEDGSQFGKVVDALDVADVESESDHAYESPAPLGGWTVFDVRLDARGAPRFDAGRTIPEGQSERFTLREDAPSIASLVIRTDDSDADVRAAVTRGGALLERVSLGRSESEAEGRWVTIRAPFENALDAGDRLDLFVERGTLRDYHVWIVSEAADARDPHPPGPRGALQLTLPLRGSAGWGAARVTSCRTRL